MSKPDYWKCNVFPDGFKCPKCEGVHFHPEATILPTITAEAPDPKGKDGKVKLWVARSECLGSFCDGFIDWTFHPDYPNGYGNEWRSIIEWNTNPLGLQQFKDFPRSKRVGA